MQSYSASDSWSQVYAAIVLWRMFARQVFKSVRMCVGVKPCHWCSIVCLAGMSCCISVFGSVLLACIGIGKSPHRSSGFVFVRFASYLHVQ